MIKNQSNSESYECPSTRMINVSPMRCIADSTGRSQLQSMEANELYDEDF